MLKRVVGVGFMAIGVVVGVHTIVEPLYYVSSASAPYSPAWDIIDPLMALAVVFGVAYAALRKRVVDRDGRDAPVTRAYLAANTLFYGFLLVGILFFLSWFNLLSPAFSAIGADAASVIWAIIDATLPLLCGAMGVSLFKAE